MGRQDSSTRLSKNSIEGEEGFQKRMYGEKILSPGNEKRKAVSYGSGIPLTFTVQPVYILKMILKKRK